MLSCDDNEVIQVMIAFYRFSVRSRSTQYFKVQPFAVQQRGLFLHFCMHRNPYTLFTLDQNTPLKPSWVHQIPLQPTLGYSSEFDPCRQDKMD